MRVTLYLLACSVLLLFWNSPPAGGQCLQYPVPLAERVAASRLVVEGTVGVSESFWAPGRRFIYTAHRVTVHRLWKGSLPPAATEIWILTLGGQVGDTICRADPALELRLGQTGVFLAEDPAGGLPAERAGLPLLQPVADGQGFIRFDGQRASDLFHTYDDLEQVLYPRLAQLTGNAGLALQSRPKPEVDPDRPHAPPSISGFSPTSVTAGTGTILTIDGSNFGPTPGKVEFGDADQPPGNFIDSQPDHIVSWSNTQIQIRVPTRAGTGRLRVTNSTNEVSPLSAGTLTVIYNLINTRDSNQDFRLKLVDRDSTGGVLFFPTAAFRSNAAAFAAFERALTEWRCKTNVNFQLANQTTTIDCNDASDNLNIVGFAGSSCPLGAGKLGVCFAQYVRCVQTGEFLAAAIDLLFVPTAPNAGWNFGPGATAGNRFDFESVALHELGHAHGLGHVINSAYVMNFSLGVNTDLRSLNAASDVAGGNDVLNFSATGPGCGVEPMQRIDAAQCAYDKPRIQFERRRFDVREQTQASSGCRGYRDHSINLIISAPPAQAVTVDLSIVNGTAYVPADLELLQNSVVFPAGSSQPRSLTLRVWDDVALEGNETARIVATVAAGSAAYFSDFFALTVVIRDNDDIPGLLLRQTFEPGSTRLGEWQALLQNPSMPNSFALSTNTPISGSGSLHITNNTATAPYQYTTNDPLESLAVALSPAIDATGLNNLQAAFKYRVAGESTGPTANRDYGSLGWSLVASPTLVNFFVGNPTNGSVATPFVNQPVPVDYVSPVFPAAVNNSQFHLAFLWKNNATGGTQPPWMIDDLEVTGGVAIQQAISSSTQYLGPFGRVFFRTPAGNLMAQIENLTDHDYGCTEVAIDRAGTGAVQFQNPQNSGFVTLKTFRVTPANPNPTGHYRITLYYTANEITSWETATGRNRNQLNILRSPDPIPNNVAAGAGYGSSPRFTDAYGGHAISAEFTTGFSGFAGSISTVDGPLPLADFALEGERSETSHRLTWTDNRRNAALAYRLEHQTARHGWQPLAQLPVAGPAHFLHPAPEAGWNRYRLLAQRLDGRMEASNLVELFHRELLPVDGGSGLRLFPNPASDWLTVEWPTEGLARVRLYDGLGRRIDEREPRGAGRLELDVRQLPAGLFYLEIESPSGERQTLSWWKKP